MFNRDTIIANALPYPVYARRPQIAVLTGSQAFDLEIMERDERINKICEMARSLWIKGLDPQDYTDEIFDEVGIDIDSLTDDEVEKINSACS